MAQLVHSIGQPFKKYPGGVVALRAIDWMGASRGTLTTESDSRSIAGTVVREAQKVSNMFTNYGTVFMDAEDTFTIPLSELRLEHQMRYLLAFSFFVEGDHDYTNTNTTITASNSNYSYYALDFRISGDGFRPTENINDQLTIIFPRNYDIYQIEQANAAIWVEDSTEVLHLRAYSESGTTIALLYDHIWMFPYQWGSNENWSSFDFRLVAGSLPDYSGYYPWVDGADGGDSLGKFTFYPYYNQQSYWDYGDWGPWTSDPGGGDHQRKSSAASAEYCMRVVGDDFEEIWDSRADDWYSPQAEPKACHCYGVHGAFINPSRTLINDHFSRTLFDGDYNGPDNHFVGSHWGDTPEGYGWNVVRYAPAGPVTSSAFGFRYGRALWVDGSRANMCIAREYFSDTGSLGLEFWPSSYGSGNNPNRTALTVDNGHYSGKFRVDYVVLSGSSPSFIIDIATGANWNQVGIGPASLRFDAWARTWKLSSGGTDNVHGPINIGSWWTGSTPSSEVGFRIHIDRYRLRVRVWDASGAEPDTWDYDDYVHIYPAGAYPYNDNPESAWDLPASSLSVAAHAGNVQLGTPGFQVQWDDIKVETDEGSGTRSPTHYTMERPEGTQIDQIEIPPGAQQVVYWGTRDWTTWDSYYQTPLITFSAKEWNELSAPSKQSAVSQWYWFRSVHGWGRRIIRYR